LDKTENKLRKLLTDFKFSRVKDVLGIQPVIKQLNAIPAAIPATKLQ
jgi:hypothetical protein